MGIRNLLLTVLAGVSLSFSGWAAGLGGGLGNGNHGNNNNQKPDKDPNWASTSFDDAKKAAKPVLLLVRNDKEKQHHSQKLLLEILDDAGVKAEIPKFTKAE